MTKTISKLKLWMLAATPDQQKALADRAGTSRAYLYHLAGGFRDASAELAREIERVALAMHRETRGQLPKIHRTDLNAACRGCEFAAKCLGATAVASDFDYIEEAAA